MSSEWIFNGEVIFNNANNAIVITIIITLFGDFLIDICYKNHRFAQLKWQLKATNNLYKKNIVISCWCHVTHGHIKAPEQGSAH